MKKLMMFLLVLVLLLVAAGLATPSDYSVEHKVVIDATPAEVHAYVGELRKWPDWAPWHEDDPTIETTFGEKTTGVGAHQSWTSKDGEGELTFTRCDPVSGIAYDMNFMPDEETVSPAKSAMDYRVVDGGTEVTWSMQGDWAGVMPPVLDGLMKLFTPMIMGGMFDTGLANLKTAVEAGPAGA